MKKTIPAPDHTPPPATSKVVFRWRVLLAAMGSPDLRQIDGVGGAHPLTSKVAVLCRPTQPGADVEMAAPDLQRIHLDGALGQLQLSARRHRRAAQSVAPEVTAFRRRFSQLHFVR